MSIISIASLGIKSRPAVLPGGDITIELGNAVVRVNSIFDAELNGEKVKVIASRSWLSHTQFKVIN